eukprot:jgi/Psemu1/52816/gm1.52816_g
MAEILTNLKDSKVTPILKKRVELSHQTGDDVAGCCNDVVQWGKRKKIADKERDESPWSELVKTEPTGWSPNSWIDSDFDRGKERGRTNYITILTMITMVRIDFDGQEKAYHGQIDLDRGEADHHGDNLADLGWDRLLSLHGIDCKRIPDWIILSFPKMYYLPHPKEEVNPKKEQDYQDEIQQSRYEIERHDAVK